MSVPAAHVSPTAWYSDPDFVAARQRTIPPGGATFYNETPPIGRVPWDMTDFIYGQATWSTRHMPNILYRLRPDNDWVLFKTTGPPQQKVDALGRPVYEQWPTNPLRPRPLLDFEILPDRIGSQEHWWRFEAWRRLDPRIRWCDISMRMETPYRINDTLLRSRISRPRGHFCILSWFQGPRGQTANDVIVRGLTHAQIQANTTRGSTPGLIDPTQGRAGGRVYLEYEGSGDDTVSESSFSGESQEESGDDNEEGKENGEEEDEKVKEEEKEAYDSEDATEMPPPKRRRISSADESSTATESMPNRANTVLQVEASSLETFDLATAVPGTNIPHSPSRALMIAHGTHGLSDI